MNTDIKNKLFKYYRYIVCIILFVVFNNCDNPQAPTWQTEINLPLLSSEFLFSDMLESEGVDSDDGLIIFSDSIVFEFPDETSFELDESYFSISGFELDGYDSEPQTIPTIPALPIEQKTESFAQEGVEDRACIPVETIEASLEDIDISIEADIELGDEAEANIKELFSTWEYATIGSATLDLNENINLFFPTSFTYTVTGYDMDGDGPEPVDTIFNNNVFNELGPTRIFDNITFDLTLDYSPNNSSAAFIECTGFYPIDGDVGNFDPDNWAEFTGWEYNSNKTSVSAGGSGSSFAIESIESINGTTEVQIITQLDTISIPTIDGMPFGILGGLVSDDTNNANSMAFSITNNSSFPETINFSLKLPNFENDGNPFLIDNIEVTTTLAGGGPESIDHDGDGDFSNHEFNYYAGCDLIDTEADCINNCEWNTRNTNGCIEVAHEIDYLYMEIELYQYLLYLILL